MKTDLVTSGKALCGASNAAFCVCLGGTGRLSCVNPFSILHRGVVFFGFQKNKLSGNDFSVGFFFLWATKSSASFSATYQVQIFH